MKFQSKVRVAMTAVALAFAGPAAADIATGGVNPGNGELFLSVWNSNLAVSYTRDLGITINNFLPTGNLSPADVTPGNGVDYAFGAAPSSFTANVLTPGYKLVFGNDGTAAASTLSTLLSTAGTVWSVVGSKNLGPDRLLFTSNNVQPAQINDIQLATSTSNVISHLSAVNAIQPGSAANTTSNLSSIANPPSAAYSGGTVFGANLGTWPFATTAAVGSSLNFWTVAQGGPLTPYTGAQWSLDNSGVLAFQAAPIPEPEMWAMLTAGLLVVGRLARKRKTGMHIAAL